MASFPAFFDLPIRKRKAPPTEEVNTNKKLRVADGSGSLRKQLVFRPRVWALTPPPSSPSSVSCASPASPATSSGLRTPPLSPPRAINQWTPVNPDGKYHAAPSVAATIEMDENISDADFRRLVKKTRDPTVPRRNVQKYVIASSARRKATKDVDSVLSLLGVTESDLEATLPSPPSSPVLTRPRPPTFGRWILRRCWIDMIATKQSHVELLEYICGIWSC